MSGWYDAQMPSAANLVSAVRVLDLVARHRPGGLPHRLGEGHEVVGGRRWRFEVPLVPNHLPPAGSGQGTGVMLAQVVRVGFGECRKRTNHGGRLGIDIGQRGDGLLGAAIAGATPR
jgi:hypothetical protein